MPEAAQPSTANVATACAIVGLVTGYLIGQAKSLGLFGGSPISAAPGRKEQLEDSEEESDEDDSAPNEFAGSNEECKLVLVVRTDLGMTKGTRSHTTLLRPTENMCRQDWSAVRPRDAGLL